MKIQNWTRRNFIKNTALFALTLPLLQTLLRETEAHAKDVPLPAGQTQVSETDPMAAALGFHHDAKKTDFTKYPDRKKPAAKNNICKNCLQYNAVNEGWGKCNIFATGLVSSQGWCSTYSPKTT